MELHERLCRLATHESPGDDYGSLALSVISLFDFIAADWTDCFFWSARPHNREDVEDMVDGRFRLLQHEPSAKMITETAAAEG